MQPKTTLLFLFFLVAAGAPTQQILPPEVRPARPVEEPGNPAPSTPPVEPVNPPPTPPVEPVSPPVEPTAPAPEPEPRKPAATNPTPTPATTAGTAGAGETEEIVPAAAMNAAALLPIGVPSFDVRMPEFSQDLLVSRMRVRELTRIDEQQLDLRDMDLERYLPDGSLDYVINVERGFYELSTGRLISSAPTRLRGKSIDLHGQGCVYSRGNEVIKILGKVTSYIYVEKGQLTSTETDAPAGESAPAAPPANP